jgi:hypothetical protein
MSPRVRPVVLCAARLAFAALLAGGFVASASAAEQKPKKEEPAKAKPAAPSGLTGNVLPRCEAGSFAAGHICKPAPPGFYAVSGGTFPIRCPPGTTSPAGSRSRSECR